MCVVGGGRGSWVGGGEGVGLKILIQTPVEWHPSFSKCSTELSTYTAQDYSKMVTSIKVCNFGCNSFLRGF